MHLPFPQPGMLFPRQVPFRNLRRSHLCLVALGAPRGSLPHISSLLKALLRNYLRAHSSSAFSRLFIFVRVRLCLWSVFPLKYKLQESRILVCHHPRCTPTTASDAHLRHPTGSPLAHNRPSPHAVSYTHLTLPTNTVTCRSRWSPYH